MKASKQYLAATVAGILSVGTAMSVQAVPDQPEKWEKCAGVAKAGKNDCGALDGSHGCAGMAKEDDSPNEWVYVAEGTCEKLTGGKVVETVPAK